MCFSSFGSTLESPGKLKNSDARVTHRESDTTSQGWSPGTMITQGSPCEPNVHGAWVEKYGLMTKSVPAADAHGRLLAFVSPHLLKSPIPRGIQ